MFTAWLGEHSAAPARALFNAARIPTYETPEDGGHRVPAPRPLSAQPGAADGDARRPGPIRSSRSRRRPTGDRRCPRQRPILARPGRSRDRARCLRHSAPAIASRRRSRRGRRRGRGARLPGRAENPLAGHRPQIRCRRRSRSDLGDAGAVREAAAAMLARVGSATPQARIDGVPRAADGRAAATRIELLAGISRRSGVRPGDRVRAGRHRGRDGATTARSGCRRSIRCWRAPRWTRTRVWRLLQGYRDKPPAAIDAIAEVLIRLGQLAAEHPEIRELDINPLLADAAGVIALDARIRVAPATVRSLASRDRALPERAGGHGAAARRHRDRAAADPARGRAAAARSRRAYEPGGSAAGAFSRRSAA